MGSVTNAAVLALGTALVLGAASACSSSDSSTTDCAKIDRFKELEIVDDAVVLDARSSNAANGPWSFRHVVESVAPQGIDPSEFVQQWFSEWVNGREFNGYPIETTPGVGQSRSSAMGAYVVCPWLKATPSNQCDDACSTCAARKLDMAYAPFKLLALANRIDLRSKPEKAGAPNGEMRFVFGLTRGPGDVRGAEALPMTIIFEFDSPKDVSPREWASRWHALSNHASFDEAYNADLQAITDRVLARDNGASGARLSQVRTNESVLFWIWQLREFRLDASGRLRTAPVANTPSLALNGSASIATFITTNADAVRQEKFVVPDNLLGAAVEATTAWTIPLENDELKKAFIRNTCNGCHTATVELHKRPFQIDPALSGPAKLAAFVNNPADPKNDDLGRREREMISALCQ